MGVAGPVADGVQEVERGLSLVGPWIRPRASAAFNETTHMQADPESTVCGVARTGAYASVACVPKKQRRSPSSAIVGA